MQQEEISIFTDEPVVYSGFWRRFAAAFLDGIILAIPAYMIGMMFSGNDFYTELIYNRQFRIETIPRQLTVSVVQWLYYALMESSASQATIGKMALGIKVTDLNGERVSFGKATGRYFGKILSALILLIGYIMVAWDDKKQALHDKLAGTLVIRKQS